MEIPKEEKEYGGKYTKYEVEGWADTLIRAEEIRKDPEKMKYVKMCLDKKEKEIKTIINSIDDIRKIRQKKSDLEENEYMNES